MKISDQTKAKLVRMNFGFSKFDIEKVRKAEEKRKRKALKRKK